MNPRQFLRRLLPGSAACSWAAMVVLAAGLHARAKGATADEAMASIRLEAIRADMRFPADDALEGRGIETHGYAVAAKFMASEFEGLGLEPAGQSGYFQNVPLRSMRPDESKTSMTWMRAGTPETLIFRQDYTSSGDPNEDVMLWPLRDILAFGAEHSSLGDVVERAAKRLNLSVSPDPMPQQVAFIRSDQYSFVKQGIPAILPTAGFKSTDPKIHPDEIFENWESTRYHQPQDDMDQPGLDFDAPVHYARFIFLCGDYVAQDARRPRWNTGDFFGDLYGQL